jgi:thiamine biosynthesis lipoprotein
MGTVVTIEVVRPDSEEAVEKAFRWFREIEACCTKFDPGSELMQLTAQPGKPAPVSAILFEAVRFAVTAAEATDGAFDPTLCGAYRDIALDEEARTIELHRPLKLDLGAVAKGLAVDAAARELEPFEDYAIDAGGDLYLGGCNPNGEPWTVGISHPRREGEILRSLRISGQAVCTSGDYERGEHIFDARQGRPANAVCGVTVVASSAMLADALATAAYVLGPEEGIELLERMGVEGLIFTPDWRQFETRGFADVA